MAFRLGATALLLAGLMAGSASAQEFVRGDCLNVVQPTRALRFEDDTHARWYKRFWTGNCQDLSLCFPGSPNWNDIVTKLLVKGGSAEKPTLLPKACKLGQLIGMEWARDRRIKRISTQDLKRFSGILDDAGDPLKGVEAVEVKARALLAKPKG
ncbi:hypothetical protein [Caulobacter endophyticus]|uniref:hypothetical protein n=1 Tax=Caulobacter endophyticus TaxID=2172652 RepID=UPI00240F6BC2|nr:hypothetical protein [Caulobacter endophyticus]MDG2530615.1 hypothetical protein [Caulobacter endophyticus]